MDVEPGAEVIEAAVQQPVEDAQGAATDAGADGASEAESGGDSFLDAFRAARAELATGDTDSGSGQDSTTDSAPPATPPDSEGAQQNAAETTPRGDRSYSFHGALRRLSTLVEQQRLGELTPEEAGEMTRLRALIAPDIKADFEQEQAREQSFREMFLQLDYEFNEDPRAWADRIAGDPGFLEFYELYKRDHPGLTYETADKPRTFSEEHVHAAVRDGVRDARAKIDAGLREALKEIAAEHDVDFDALSNSSSGTGSLMAALVSAAAEKKAAGLVEKQLPARLEAETKALKQERDALRAQAAQSPRGVRTILRDPRTVSAPSKGESMQDAYREAREAMGIT